jgi:hypothetical protein
MSFFFVVDNIYSAMDWFNAMKRFDIMHVRDVLTLRDKNFLLILVQ